MHHAEKLLSKALILVGKAARSEDLKALVEAHQKETVGHVKCIEEVAASLEAKLPHRKGPAMTRLIEETVLLIAKAAGSPVLDSAIIAAALKIEHYEIASYGTLCAWAERLGFRHEFPQLKSTLNQEKLAESLLTSLSEGARGLPNLVEETSLKIISKSVAKARK